MIEISFSKLVLLALIALIVLGPEKLPRAARTAGILLRRVRQGWDSMRVEVERELEVEELRRSAREAARQAQAVEKEVKHGLEEIRKPLNETVAVARSVQSLPESPAQATRSVTGKAKAESDPDQPLVRVSASARSTDTDAAHASLRSATKKTYG